MVKKADKKKAIIGQTIVSLDILKIKTEIIQSTFSQDFIDYMAKFFDRYELESKEVEIERDNKHKKIVQQMADVLSDNIDDSDGNSDPDLCIYIFAQGLIHMIVAKRIWMQHIESVKKFESR